MLCAAASLYRNAANRPNSARYRPSLCAMICLAGTFGWRGDDMANKKLFQTKRGMLVPAANAVNEAGGLAYALGPKAALAQFAATGCLNGTFYATADEQLGNVLALCARVEPEFVAKTA